MKVLQLVQKPQRRGAEIFAYDLNRQLEALGNDVKTVYLYGYKGDKPLPLNGSDVRLEGREDHVFERYPGFHPALLRQVIQEIRSFNPEIVQVNGARTVKYGAAAKFLEGGNVGWRLIYRNINIPSHWHHCARTRVAYRLAIMPQIDGVIGVCSLALEDAKELYNLRVPSVVILNGISPQRLHITESREEIRRRNQTSPGDFILLFLGSLVPQKRPDRFVRVLAQVSLEDPRIRSWMVGEGPLREDTERLAEELGVRARIRFFGNQDSIARFFVGADLFVMTSDTEGVPATVLEAGYLGLPVVSTSVGGLEECVTGGETGILVEDLSEDGLGKAILKLAAREDLRRSMGEKARERMLRDATIERVAEKYLDFYRRMCASTVIT